MGSTFNSSSNESSLNQAFERFESLLSSNKAREILKQAEDSLSFDIEVYMAPVRKNLGDCMELIGDLVRERGTVGRELQAMIPVLHEYLDPSSEAAREVARLEKRIAEKKREHPDFVMAFKLQVLVKRYQTSLNDVHPESEEFQEINRKLENARATLAKHMQSKVRIAQRALEPDLLEQAVSQLELARRQEKILRIKQELLDACRNQCNRNLNQMAKIFKEVEPELADVILAQMNAVHSTGALIKHDKEDAPQNLNEYKQALEEKGQQIEQFNTRLSECQTQLEQLQKLEEAIFNTFGEQLREKGITFKKKARLEKTGVGVGSAKKVSGLRMVTRERR